MYHVSQTATLQKTNVFNWLSLESKQKAEKEFWGGKYGKDSYW